MPIATFLCITVKILNIGTYMSEQTVLILIRLLLRSSLIRIYTVCHTVYIFWRHYCIVKLNCFILRTTTVVSLGVLIFRVFTVNVKWNYNARFWPYLSCNISSHPSILYICTKHPIFACSFFFIFYTNNANTRSNQGNNTKAEGFTPLMHSFYCR